jgi:uncharacterized HhH-GPD family protein
MPMPRHAGFHRVAEELLAYGRELETLGAAQSGAGFTGRDDADELLAMSPNAFLLGALFTQGVSAERAWAGPFLLRERLGTLDLGYLAANEKAVREAVQRPPMLHRFKDTLPGWICSAAKRLLAEYGGDASRVWPSGAAVAEVLGRLEGFDGIGRKKAVMMVEILTRHFGVELVGREFGQVAFDVHVRRVFLRAGLSDLDSRDAIEAAASAICPEAPGTLDLAAWLIGREACRPKAPRCDACRLGAVCPRLVERNIEGVGARGYSADRKTRPERSLG